MKKNSKQGKKAQASAVFSNAPFKALKGLRPSGSAPAAPAPHQPAQDTAEPDDADLFLQAVRGARPVAPDRGEDADTPPARQLPAPAAQPDHGEDREHDIFLQAMGSLGTAVVREDDLADADGGSAPVRSSSGRMRQLKRGTIGIGEELDLHGFLKDEALRRLGHFISSAHARGLAAVLVITGKGHNSPEGPVLPGAVDAWLREQGRSMVAEFHPAPRDKGGSGAYVVFLKQRR
jgi:DNA-nicking Smr family endonuclease